MTRNAYRVIDYLRISVTDRCNFRCTYCMPAEGVAGRPRRDILSFEEITKFTQAAADIGVTRVRITGGEPLVRRGLPELISRLARVPGIRDLSLTTNGAMLGKHAAELKAAGLSRINISINSLDPERFSHVTRGAELDPVLAGLEQALSLGFNPLKVNAVMLDGIEADVPAFVTLVKDRPVHVRFIEFMPIGKRRGGIWKFVSRQRVMRELAAFGDLKPAHAPEGGGPARYFRFEGARGTIGFVSSMSDHFCSSCNRIRLTADGRLRNCLFSDDEVDVRPYISGDTEQLKRVILDSMNSKRFDRQAEDPGRRTMSQIGG